MASGMAAGSPVQWSCWCPILGAATIPTRWPGPPRDGGEWGRPGCQVPSGHWLLGHQVMPRDGCVTPQGAGGNRIKPGHRQRLRAPGPQCGLSDDVARASVTHSGILGGHGCPLRVGPHGHRWGWSPEVSPAWPGMQRPQGLPLVPAQHSSDSRARNPPSTPAYLGSPALHSSPGPSSVLPSPCDCAPGADSLCPGLCCSSGPQPSVRPPTTAAQVPSHTCHIFKGSSAWRKD